MNSAFLAYLFSFIVLSICIILALKINKYLTIKKIRIRIVHRIIMYIVLFIVVLVIIQTFGKPAVV